MASKYISELPPSIGPYDIIRPGWFIRRKDTDRERKLIKEVALKMTMAVPKEIEEHLTLCNWLNKHGVFFIHIPNEGQRSVQQTVLLKRMGMKKGAPDFIIPGPENIAIELKRCKVTGKSGKQITSSKVSEAQKECLGDMAELGWTTYVAYGAADAIGFLQGRNVVKKPLKKIAGTMVWGKDTSGRPKNVRVVTEVIVKTPRKVVP